MSRLGQRDIATVRDITRSLELLDLERPSALDALTPRLHGDLGIDCATAYSITAGEDAFHLGALHATGCSVGHARFSRAMNDYVRGSRDRVGSYNPLRPEPLQRNRVFADLTARHLVSSSRRLSKRFGLTAAGLEAFRTNAEHLRRSFAAMGVLDQHQIRVLICDGPTLLAWVGGSCVDAPTPRQRAMLGALVAPLQRRLRIEELLRANATTQSALAAAMEQLPGAAFLTTGSGQIRHANSAGAHRLHSGRRQLADAIAAAIRRDSHTAPLRAIPIRDPGLPTHFLILEPLARGLGAPARTDAARRYGLTPREGEVLALLCRGESNKAIASELGCAERTAEVHVSRILAKLDVDSRAAAIARVLADAEVD